jgi:alpha-mannosidase
MCYDDSDELYAKIFEIGTKLRKDALEALGIIGKSDSCELVALNTLPWPRTEVVKVPPALSTSTGPEYAVATGSTGLINFNQDNESGMAVTVKEVQPGVFRLQNDNLKVDVKDGVIISLYDIEADREVVAKGGNAGQLVIFDDKPLYWQAWDVEVFHLESRKELPSGKTVITENSPHRVSVMTETKISDKSWIKTTISLSRSSTNEPSYVEMESEVEWRETMKFLKVEFPVDITNTEASYETQYGIIKRPTHYNTRYVLLTPSLNHHKTNLI